MAETVSSSIVAIGMSLPKGLNRVLHRCANVPVRFLVWRLRVPLGQWGRRVVGWCGGVVCGDLRVVGLMWVEEAWVWGRCGRLSWRSSSS